MYHSPVCKISLRGEFSEEDKKLRWKPVFETCYLCPECGGRVCYDYRYDRSDPRPWADPIFSGYWCPHCHYRLSADSLDSLDTETQKCYDLSTVSLGRNISEEFENWCKENDITDVRDERIKELRKMTKEDVRKWLRLRSDRYKAKYLYNISWENGKIHIQK